MCSFSNLIFSFISSTVLYVLTPPNHLLYRLSDPAQYQSIVDAEWNIIYDKLDKCVKSGAKVVLSRLAIGDLATQVGYKLALQSIALINDLIFTWILQRARI